LAWPALALLVFAALPFLILLRISVAPHDPSAPWGSGFTLSPYAELVDTASMTALLHSLWLAIVVGAISLGVGFPLAYLVTRMHRRSQVVWLIFLLATLTLSDVLIAFSWQVMLSKRIGLSKLLVWLGLLDRPESLTPSDFAVIACLVYLVLPFTVLTLFPALSRLDRTLIEAARTAGASPARAFASIVLPLTKLPSAIAFLISAVLTMGAYVAPIVLGRPQHWPMAVLIGSAALQGHDLPRAAAMSVLLLIVTIILALAATRAVAMRRPHS
jgi:putative spermidine/putrescine transport system permease protein